MNTNESKQTWVYVALYDGKKVKKYFTPMEEFSEIDWISETKFSYRNDNQSYCEGIVLAKADDERSLRNIVSKKLLRVPHNTFRPFPDLNTKRATMLEKWKKRLTTIALNDSSILKKPLSPLSKEVPVDIHTTKQPSDEPVNIKMGNEPTNLSDQQIDNYMYSPENKPLPEKDFNPGFHQYSDDNEKQTIQSLNKVESPPKMSSEGVKLSSYSRNVAEYVTNKRRSPSLSDSDNDLMNDTRLIRPNLSKKAEKFPLHSGMVSKRKYMKLLQKYNLLKTMFIEQREQYAKDLKIQYLAHCLYRAIKHRYSSDEEENE